MMCVLNAIDIKRATRYKQEVYKTFIVPLISSAVMGVVSFLVYLGLEKLTKSNSIAFIANFFSVSEANFLSLSGWK